MLIHDVFVYLHVRNATAALRFYTEVFDAQETLRIDMPDGRVGHAEIRIGPMVFMLADEFPERGVQSPLAFGGSGTTLHLHVDDVDALARRAWDAGAMILREPADEEHGERQCRLRDPSVMSGCSARRSSRCRTRTSSDLRNPGTSGFRVLTSRTAGRAPSARTLAGRKARANESTSTASRSWIPAAACHDPAG
jgi:uncharacterized glyoxalase superfamily protein PhnB